MDQFNTELAQSLAPNIMGLTVFPTEQCCFRCTYCYEDFELGKMPPTIQQGIIKLLQKRAPQLDHLLVSWFGGEPLMAKDVIYTLSAQMLDLARQYNIEYAASMTTNAYLLDKACYEHLVKLHVSNYQISLDGTEAFHDQTRIRVDGKGTYREIMNNLLAIKTSDLDSEIELRLHYTPSNWQNLMLLVDEIKDTLLDDERFQVIFRAVGKWGGNNDDQYEIFDHEQDCHQVEVNLLKHLYGAQFELDQALSQEEPTFNVCYAAKANHLAIRANGQLAKCTVALNQANNNVGNITDQGELVIHQTRFKRWLTGFQTGDIEQLGCPASVALQEAPPTTTLQGIPVISAAA